MQAIHVERTRQIETDFIIERYHRAFDDELAVICGLIRATRPKSDATERLARALHELEKRMGTHMQIQELRLFPAFEKNGPRDPSMIEAWASDAIKLLDAVDAVCVCSGALENATLKARVSHIIDEIQDHLSVEARVLAPWLKAPVWKLRA